MSIFLGVQDINAIKLELKYWLQFIASNTRRSKLYRPHMSIIMTHFDLWNDNPLFIGVLEDVIKQLKEDLEDLLLDY